MLRICCELVANLLYSLL